MEKGLCYEIRLNGEGIVSGFEIERWYLENLEA
jgi:hypothetical protein